MGADHVVKDLLVRLAGLRIDSDHFAAWIALHDGNPQTVADLKRASQKVVLAVGMLLDPIDIKICPKTAAIHRQAEFFAKTFRCGIAENRDWTAVIEAAFAEAQRDRFAAAPLEIGNKFTRPDRVVLAFWCFNIDRERLLRRKDLSYAHISLSHFNELTYAS
jgi:hypothetical protein